MLYYAIQDSINEMLVWAAIVAIILYVIFKIKELITKCEFLQKQLDSVRKDNSRLQKEINELKEERKESD